MTLFPNWTCWLSCCRPLLNLLSDESMTVRLRVLAELSGIVSSFCLHDGLDMALGPPLVAMLQDASLDSKCCLAILRSLGDIVSILKISKVCCPCCATSSASQARPAHLFCVMLCTFQAVDVAGLHSSSCNIFIHILFRPCSLLVMYHRPAAAMPADLHRPSTSGCNSSTASLASQFMKTSAMPCRLWQSVCPGYF